MKLFFTYPNRGFHPLTPGPIPLRVIGILRHFCNCLGISGNANLKTDLNSIRIRIGGQGVEPPVRKKVSLALYVGGI